MRKVENQIGKKYGMLIIISEHSKTRNGHYRYICQCDCGKTANVILTHLRQGNTKSCGCNIPLGCQKSQWNGVGEMSGDYWSSHIVRSAKGNKGSRKELDLTITKEYVWNLFLKQKRKCALSGIELTFPSKWKDRSYTASLDRVDSSEGYIEGNVQWVHKDINFMKRTYSQEYFIDMCKKVTENNI